MLPAHVLSNLQRARLLCGGVKEGKEQLGRPVMAGSRRVTRLDAAVGLIEDP